MRRRVIAEVPDKLGDGIPVLANGNGRIVTDWLRRAGPGNGRVRDRAAWLIEMIPLGVPQRVIHGREDDIVPISISRGYVMAALSEGDDAKLIEIPGAGHFEWIDPLSSAWPIVKQAVPSLVQ